jgi:DNA-binding transcriptional ArsR family regulator
MAGVFSTPRPLPSQTIPLVAGAAVIVLALPIFLAAGWRLEGWVIGATLWAASRLLALLLTRIFPGSGTLAASGVMGFGMTFRALADPTRRGMLARLAGGDQSIGELGQPFRMTFAGAAKHVKVLESAGLIERRKAGRQQICTLRAEPLAEAERWLRQWEIFWSAGLDGLEAIINDDKETNND